MNQLDEMFASGPEMLVAESHAIVAGPVSYYSKEVKEQSQGAAPIPVRWVVSGQLEHPETLKGDPPGSSLRVSRQERSPFLPALEPVPAWEAKYGQWQPDDKAVAFLGKKSGEILRVLPSGIGERDLISVVRLIVSLQATSQSTAAQVTGWRNHLLHDAASSAESKRVALRSLMKLTRNWSDIAPAFRGLISGKDRDVRRYTYGVVAYGIVNEKWADPSEPAEFLCTQLANELDEEVTASYLEYVELVLRYAADENFREARNALWEQLHGCARDR
jgi:hypothetical protein